MATKMLESSAVSAFCESVAVMHSAGIQMDEAVFLLGENMEDAAFKRACDDVYKEQKGLINLDDIVDIFIEVGNIHNYLENAALRILLFGNPALG